MSKTHLHSSFTAALSPAARIWDQSRGSPADAQIDSTVLYTVEYYSASSRKRISSFHTWMNLEDTVLRAVSQAQMTNPSRSYLCVEF